MTTNSSWVSSMRVSPTAREGDQLSAAVVGVSMVAVFSMERELSSGAGWMVLIQVKRGWLVMPCLAREKWLLLCGALHGCVLGKPVLAQKCDNSS